MWKDSSTSSTEQAFITRAQRAPYLSLEEEQTYARAVRDFDDPRAKAKLVESHLRQVLRIANGYRGYGHPIMTLISEGYTGLVQAANKFDPELGTRFATYSQPWIKALITEYVLYNGSMVKNGTTANQKRLFFGLSRAKRELAGDSGSALTERQTILIAASLGVTREEVTQANQRQQMDVSLNTPMSQDEDSSERQDFLPDHSPNQEELLGAEQDAKFRSKILKRGLENADLDDREKDIFIERRLRDEPLTLAELAERHVISRERVRQLEARAFEKVQRAVCELAHEEAPDDYQALPPQPRRVRALTA